MSKKYKFKNPCGTYFTTTTVVYWADVFTRPLYKNIVVDSLIYCQKQKGLEIFAWCLMTNHLHLIVRAKEGFELPYIFRDWKKFTSKKIFETIENNLNESRRGRLLALFERAGKYNYHNQRFQFWQEGNHPIELDRDKIYDQKLEYIHNNPIKAGIVFNAVDYVYSSARDYAGTKGLIELDIEY